jgi:hypothetical protein
MQHIGALFYHLYITALGAFAATELGNFNAFSFYSMQIMVWVAAGLTTLAGFWALIVASIAIADVTSKERPRVPPIHRSAAAWWILMAAWWTLGKFFWSAWNGRTGLFTPAEQANWIELNYSLLFVVLATSYEYWAEVVEFTALKLLHMCGATNNRLYMLI